jgi:hypothetical protein
VPEQIDSTSTSPSPSPSQPQPVGGSPFSGEACDLLGATVRDYLETGGAPDELARATARLCKDAQARGLSADETLVEIRATLGGILAACPLTSTDRAALVALAIDECVHAYYNGRS